MIGDNYNFLRCRPHPIYSRRLEVVDTLRSCSCHQSSPTQFGWKSEQKFTVRSTRPFFSRPHIKEKKAVWLRETMRGQITGTLDTCSVLLLLFIYVFIVVKSMWN